ncbi:MAG: acetyl-CoA carboxylase biotin carboxyl carrier protein [Gammaproteobacteria bacterium]|nr:acetyl-CoA carboxylase biotin carboxyl carrier protein [Gammaproteobacteria bacterium]
MDIRKVKKLIDLLEQTDVAELEIREGEESVRISRYSNATVAATRLAPPLATAAPSPRVLPEEPEREAVPEGHIVRAPMVGTFYRAASPQTPNFVEVGQAVVQGQTLCILEAMKIMNQIEADISGIVAGILVENGQPVEFGQPLFIIK